MSIHDRLNHDSDTEIPVNLRLCTINDKKEFFQDVDVSFEALFPSMLCIDDPKSVEFQGNFLKNKVQLLKLTLERCKDNDKCATDDEITEFKS